MSTESKDYRQMKRMLAAIPQFFRGGCLENLGGAPMGKGHNNDGKPFDVETACYLKPIFSAYDKAVRRGQRRSWLRGCPSQKAGSMTASIPSSRMAA